MKEYSTNLYRHGRPVSVVTVALALGATDIDTPRIIFIGANYLSERKQLLIYYVYK